jgi:pSer/pThr/pTyr-binding forkhead associated (FHA) protein
VPFHEIKKTIFVIGRSQQDVDLVLQDKKISHKHAVIYHVLPSRRFFLINKGKNGTRVDGLLYFKEPIELHHASLIEFQQIKVVFSLSEPSKETSKKTF